MARGRKLNAASMPNVLEFPSKKHPSASGVDISQPEIEADKTHRKLARQLMPADFDDEHKELWMATAPAMVASGRLSQFHANSYAEYIMCVIRLKKFREYLGNFEGGRWVYASGEMIKAHPLVGQMNDDWRKWRSLVGEFGLAPTAERGVIKGFKGQFNDDWQDL